MAGQVVLVRHGETEWSKVRKHTGRSDIPLTEHGRARAMALAPVLAAIPGIADALVLTSPLSRACDTAALAGIGDRAQRCDDLLEWDYGDVDGLTTAELRQRVPGWSVWTHPIDGGETLGQVGRRADAVIARVDAHDGAAVLVAHAHLLRILGARWCGFEPLAGRALVLGAASVSVLGYEREIRVIEQWNVTPAF